MRPITALIALLSGIGFNTAGLAEEDSFGEQLLKNVIEQKLDEARDENERHGLSDNSYQDKAQRERDLMRKRQQQQQTAQQRTTDNGTFIRCPVNKLRTEVVSDLPSPWWQTPQVGGLEDTRIQNIGGEATLVCAYRGYGGTVSVMREPPEGMSCEARSNGFACY